MLKFYIDTSALFKIFVEEDGSEITESIVSLAKEKKIEVMLSNWIVNESIALLDEYKRKEKIDKIKTQEIISELVDMIEGGIRYNNFKFYSVNEQIISLSRTIIVDFHVSASDALHIYMAIHSGCDYIITAD